MVCWYLYSPTLYRKPTKLSYADICIRWHHSENWQTYNNNNMLIYWQVYWVYAYGATPLVLRSSTDSTERIKWWWFIKKYGLSVRVHGVRESVTPSGVTARQRPQKGCCQARSPFVVKGGGQENGARTVFWNLYFIFSNYLAQTISITVVMCVWSLWRWCSGSKCDVAGFPVAPRLWLTLPVETCHCCHSVIA